MGRGTTGSRARWCWRRKYGGDGREVGRCADVRQPLVAFPAHWAPNDLLFYDGAQYPARFRDGVFVVFHGSWSKNSQTSEVFDI